MRELATTLLDAIGLLLIAAGLGFAAGRWIGYAALAVSGVVVLAGSLLAARLDKPPLHGGGG